MKSLLRKTEERAVNAANFGLAIDEISGNTAGVQVDSTSAMGLEAVWSAVSLLSGDISALPFNAIRQRNGVREIIEPQPAWIDTPIGYDPSQTATDHLAQVLVSLLLNGNAYVLCAPLAAPNVAEMRVLPPGEVEIKRGPRREPIYVWDKEEFTPSNILHIPLWRRPGTLEGMSPIQNLAQGIGRGLAAREMGSRFFSDGSAFGAVIQYPKEVDPDDNDVKELLKRLNKRHRGLKNAWAMGAITGGGQLVELGMKPSDAQLIETEEWTLEQVARAYKVPPSLLGSQKPGAVAYASVEQRSIDYVVHAILPLTVRIEKAYSRLLPRGSYMKFNLNGLLRGDGKARWEQYQIALQTKVMDRDEVRVLEDLNPRGYGLLETPNNNAPELGDANASQG